MSDEISVSLTDGICVITVTAADATATIRVPRPVAQSLASQLTHVAAMMEGVTPAQDGPVIGYRSSVSVAREGSRVTLFTGDRDLTPEGARRFAAEIVRVADFLQPAFDSRVD